MFQREQMAVTPGTILMLPELYGFPGCLLEKDTSLLAAYL